jgi:hypothetical protein
MAVAAMMLVFVVWQLVAPRGTWGTLKAEHFLAAVGVMAAVCGWLIAGIINLRNSIRQHTISTLLQSRLSATYMQYADKLSKHYGDYEARKAANPAMSEDATDNADILALRYILNYFEFISIGIKRGDLDEAMLRDSLRGILLKNVQISMPWIKREQLQNSHLYENLLWLYQRWLSEE